MIEGNLSYKNYAGKISAQRDNHTAGLVSHEIIKVVLVRVMELGEKFSELLYSKIANLISIIYALCIFIYLIYLVYKNENLIMYCIVLYLLNFCVYWESMMRYISKCIKLIYIFLIYRQSFECTQNFCKAECKVKLRFQT